MRPGERASAGQRPWTAEYLAASAQRVVRRAEQVPRDGDVRAGGRHEDVVEEQEQRCRQTAAASSAFGSVSM